MIEIDDLHFEYGREGFRLAIPRLRLEAGERVAVVGPSGSGKTTLLRLMAGILVPGRGSVRVDGVEVSALADGARRNFRISRVGFVFQDFELIEYLDVLDNVMLGYRINSSLKLTPAVRERARGLLASVELAGKERRPVTELSQGERQRVAICRALLSAPALVLADEPTGNLDPANKGRILQVLFDSAAQAGSTLVTVTHDHALLAGFQRVIDFAEFRAP